MPLTAVSGLSPVQPIYWPRRVAAAATEQQTGRQSHAAAQRADDDSYTATSLAAGLGGNLLAAIPQSLLSSLSAGSQQTQSASVSTLGSLLSSLSAAVSAAAEDGTSDTSWVDDLVSYAAGLGDGSGASGTGLTGGGALAGDLNTMEGVIQQIAAQLTGTLVAQGASASQASTAVKALTTSLTLNSLGAVAQQIAAQSGGQNSFTVTSSVVTISANGQSGSGSTATVDQMGEVERIAGANASVALTGNSGAVSLAGVTGSNSSGGVSDLSAQGFGYSFSIAESGPGGSVYAGTREVSASAEEASTDSTGETTDAAAAMEQSATVYESVSSAGGNNALVLLSDWEAGLVSSATGQPAGTSAAQSAQPAAGASTAAASTPAAASTAQGSTPSLADSLNALAHALFRQALAFLQSIFGGGDAGAAQKNRVDVYA